MGAVGPIGGVPVPSPATGQVPGSTALLSPGGHSPGPQTNIVPSPTQRLANIPSPGMAMNTPGWLLCITSGEVLFSFVCVCSNVCYPPYVSMEGYIGCCLFLCPVIDNIYR